MYTKPAMQGWIQYSLHACLNFLTTENINIIIMSLNLNLSA